MSAAVVLADIDGRTAGMGRPCGASDDNIEQAIVRLYAERAAAGLGQPTMPQLHEACGTKSSRVSLRHAEMRRDGRLPELATSKHQRGGMAGRKSWEERQAADKRSAYAIPHRVDQIRSERPEPAVPARSPLDRRGLTIREEIRGLKEAERRLGVARG